MVDKKTSAVKTNPKKVAQTNTPSQTMTLNNYRHVQIIEDSLVY